MSLAHGGHLTHGSPVNFSGKLYKIVSYGLDENEVIDYAQVERLAHEHRPRMIVAGASAYALVIDWKRFREIADSVGAYLLVDMAHYADWWRPASTPARSNTRTSSPAPRTRRCAGRAVG